MKRRRFLQIAASMTGAALLSHDQHRLVENTVVYQGHALGAEVSLSFRGADTRELKRDMTRVVARIQHIEKQFSLFDDNSALATLNRQGYLADPDQDMLALLRIAQQVYQLTEGGFDPTVQPWWRALSRRPLHKPVNKLMNKPGSKLNDLGDVAINSAGVDTALLGFNKVSISQQRVEFDRPGMALTLNGIAQGYASDQIAALIEHLGYPRSLINMGEFVALDEPWQIGVADSNDDIFSHLVLQGNACATSSNDALWLTPQQGHILDPQALQDQATKSTQSSKTLCIVAANASLADGLSTGLSHAPTALLQRIAQRPEVQRIIRKDGQGVQTFAAQT